MGYRVTDKDGNEYELLTEQEAQGRMDIPIYFESEAQARALVKQLMATPEGDALLRQLLADVDEQQSQ